MQGAQHEHQRNDSKVAMAAMVTAMAAAIMVTTVAVAVAKTMVATAITGGLNNNQLKTAAKETGVGTETIQIFGRYGRGDCSWC